MGDLGKETAVEPVGPGRFRIVLAEEWATWGPNGGYLASVALRAAGATTDLPRPATLTCLFLGVGAFEDTEVQVTSLRRTKRAEALRVNIVQGDNLLLEAHVWAVDEGLSGLEHDVAEAPAVPDPDDLKSTDELAPGRQHHFWKNFVRKPVSWVPPEEWPPPPPNPPVAREWLRFAPVARWDDPWADACRAVVLLDTFQWPASLSAHVNRGPDEPAFIAPSMDLSVRFHRPAVASEWLLVDAIGPVAEDGLMASEARIYAEDRRLVASGASHLLCRQVPRGTPGSGTTA